MTVEGLDEAWMYEFRIKCANLIGESEPSIPLSVIIQDDEGGVLLNYMIKPLGQCLYASATVTPSGHSSRLHILVNTTFHDYVLKIYYKCIVVFMSLEHDILR